MHVFFLFYLFEEILLPNCGVSFKCSQIFFFFYRLQKYYKLIHVNTPNTILFGIKRMAFRVFQPSSSGSFRGQRDVCIKRNNYIPHEGFFFFFFLESQNIPQHLTDSAESQILLLPNSKLRL